MKEEIVSLTTAKIAKSKGFREETSCFYNSLKGNQLEKNFLNYNGLDGWYSAPTQSLLQRWLREVHEIDITIMIRFADNYGAIIHDNRRRQGEEIIIDITYENYKNIYETVLEAALQQALNLIK